jgi:hypothetical protein
MGFSCPPPRLRLHQSQQACGGKSRQGSQAEEQGCGDLTSNKNDYFHEQFDLTALFLVWLAFAMKRVSASLNY